LRLTFVPVCGAFLGRAARHGSRPTFVPPGEPFVGCAVAADRGLWELAARQHGVLARWQLLAAGLSAAGISRLVARGWLRPIHRGVYLVGPIQGPLARFMAGTLAVGAGAVLSHRSAAELLGVGPAVRGAVSVILVGREVRSRDGIRVHHVRSLEPADITRRHGIPVTSPSRTLLDLATRLGRRDLAKAVEQAEIFGLVSVASLNEQFSRYPRHRGARLLRETIRATDAPAMTRSEAERRLLELVRAALLPSPEVNRRLHGHEVDFVWIAQRLVVEVDGYAFHSSRSAFERDRRRDADLIGAGYRVIRLTWRQLAGEREAVVALLARALAT
jgi:very-short-patch-repair endonuclease